MAALRPRAAAASAAVARPVAVRRGGVSSSSRWKLQGSMLNWKSKCSTRSPRTTVAGAKPDDSEFESVNAPLEPQTWEGSFLCGLLKNQPQVLPVAAAKQLQELSNQRKDTLIRWEHSIGSPEDCLHRRIAEMKEHECQTAIEDIMYTLIVYKFFKIEVPLVPNLSKLISNKRLQIWPPREAELESIHGPEVLGLIREHLTSIIRWVHRNGPKINRSTLRIKRMQFNRIYSASIMYGYFLKSVTTRHRLELILAQSQEFCPPIQFLNAQFNSTQKQEQEESIGGSAEISSSSKPSSVVDLHDLKSYMMGFDPKTLELCARLRSCEASNLIEKHSWALFRESMKDFLEPDEAVILDPSSLKRLLLEAIAFGSFLWDVEDYVDEIYKLHDS
uniref:UV-B-induced protein n=1 Tax=Oryza nivara TaxID=4536 RepID=A0A0E0J1P3_ORYNI